MDLRTTYMGLELRSPVVASASTLSEDVENIYRMEDAGAGAVVMFSLFEEQIRQENAFYEHVQDATTNTFAEALDYFPQADAYHVGTEKYLEIIRQATERVDIPIIASLNGITNEGWIAYARQMQEAGASGLELNIFYIPADLNTTGKEVEQRYLDIIKTVKATVTIPVAVKLNPYFSAMGHIAQQMEQAGADALVLFNRFYQPDFDIDNLQVIPSLKFSTAQEIRLPLLWISVLYGRLPASLAATTGVQGAPEVIKYLLAGTDVVMTASALYKFGIGHIGSMLTGLRNWMEGFQFTSLSDFRGMMSQKNVKNPSAFERANYIKVLESFK